jgi:hypothetical protein
MSAGALAYDLLSPYETLVAELENVADHSGCGSIKQAGPMRERFKKEANGSISFDCVLLLRNWHARKERIHIVVHVQESITGKKSDYILTRSTVRVSYYSIRGTKATPLHTVHFDYGPEQACHPIFHAQISPDCVQIPAEDLIDLGHELEAQGAANIFKNARIPTSDMTLSSVLLCLVADHIDHAFFSDFRGRVRELQDRLPRPSFEKTRASLLAQSNHFRSVHWFAHM